MPLTMTAEREADLRSYCHPEDELIVEIDAERAAHQETREVLEGRIELMRLENQQHYREYSAALGTEKRAHQETQAKLDQKNTECAAHREALGRFLTEA